MTDRSQSGSPGTQSGEAKSRGAWGPKLFLATLAALLVFFWWVLIYSGGVALHHG